MYHIHHGFSPKQSDSLLMLVHPMWNKRYYCSDWWHTPKIKPIYAHIEVEKSGNGGLRFVGDHIGMGQMDLCQRDVAGWHHQENVG